MAFRHRAISVIGRQVAALATPTRVAAQIPRHYSIAGRDGMFMKESDDSGSSRARSRVLPRRDASSDSDFDGDRGDVWSGRPANDAVGSAIDYRSTHANDSWLQPTAARATAVVDDGLPTDNARRRRRRKRGSEKAASAQLQEAQGPADPWNDEAGTRKPGAGASDAWGTPMHRDAPPLPFRTSQAAAGVAVAPSSDDLLRSQNVARMLSAAASALNTGSAAAAGPSQASADSARIAGKDAVARRAAVTAPAAKRADVKKASAALVAAPAAAAGGTIQVAGRELDVSQDRFEDLPLSDSGKEALRKMGFEFQTPVQSATLPIILMGEDVLAKAKTGTGKTVAFLLPSIERLVAARAAGRVHRDAISILVISPTRELAGQITREAEALAQCHSPAVTAACFVGGTNMNAEAKRLRRPLDICVATPGRLKDHLQNTEGFQNRLQRLQVLVLDEADHLLEMGFRKDLTSIIGQLPSVRQTLLFSATVPQEVKAVSKLALKPSFVEVDTVGEAAQQTHEHVRQDLVVCRMDELIGSVENMLLRHMQAQKARGEPYKVIVFFTTAKGTAYMSQLFKAARYSILEMHSRKTQAYRTRVAEDFRRGSNVIMFSSDVSARGMDYPDVTFVLQVGLTERSQYIHRLGRTARAGEAGQGCLMLCDWETSLLKSLKDMPLERVECSPKLSPQLASAMTHPDSLAAATSAYVAWLGYYNSNLKAVGWDKVKLVSMAAQQAACMGLPEAPALMKKTVGMMGLKGVPGLRIQ